VVSREHAVFLPDGTRIDRYIVDSIAGIGDRYSTYHVHDQESARVKYVLRVSASWSRGTPPDSGFVWDGTVNSDSRSDQYRCLYSGSCPDFGEDLEFAVFPRAEPSMDIMANRNGRSLEQTVTDVIEILKLVAELHDSGMCHGNLKATNVLRWRSQWILVDGLNPSLEHQAEDRRSIVLLAAQWLEMNGMPEETVHQLFDGMNGGHGSAGSLRRHIEDLDGWSQEVTRGYERRRQTHERTFQFFHVVDDGSGSHTFSRGRKRPSYASPRHTVEIRRPYEIALVPISTDRFGEFGFHQDGFPGTWRSAIQLCNFLSASAGLPQCYNIDGDRIFWQPTAMGYRLPTEAEWDAAFSLSEFRKKAQLVKPWEWCWDVWDYDYYEALSGHVTVDPVRDPAPQDTAGGASRYRVARVLRFLAREITIERIAEIR